MADSQFSCYEVARMRLGLLTLLFLTTAKCLYAARPEDCCELRIVGLFDTKRFSNVTNLQGFDFVASAGDIAQDELGMNRYIGAANFLGILFFSDRIDMLPEFVQSHYGFILRQFGQTMRFAKDRESVIQ